MTYRFIAEGPEVQDYLNVVKLWATSRSVGQGDWYSSWAWTLDYVLWDDPDIPPYLEVIFRKR